LGWEADGAVRINRDVQNAGVLLGLSKMGSQRLSGLTALTYLGMRRQVACWDGKRMALSG
jgi:hypothetical protein